MNWRLYSPQNGKRNHRAVAWLVGFASVTLLLPVFCLGSQTEATSTKKQQATAGEDVPSPIKTHLANAEKGDADAQVSLANAYRLGLDIEKNEKLAFDWYMKAANQGHAGAQASLGLVYRKGLGVEQDFDQAWKWYRLAAAQNLSGAFCDMGRMYQEGAGVPADLGKAIDCFRKGRELGSAFAAYHLGLAYVQGKGVRRSMLLAQPCFAEAAAGGLAGAYHNLARTYEQPEVVIRIGESKSRRLAIKYYRKAAAMGVAGSEKALRRLTPADE